MRPLVLSLVVLVACRAPDAVDGPVVASVEPPYAPLAGGSEVRMRGAGFVANDAGANRVFIDGREAPLVRTLDDAELAVVVPPGDLPGDVEIVVLNRNGNTSARGVLRYSTPPTVASASPARVLASSATTRVTLSGTGFLDEAAGNVEVLVDGQRVFDVTVVSDTELSFTAPRGRALVRPVVTVIDARGSATLGRGFQYAPSERDGLLLFPSFTPSFAMFVDPITLEVIDIPRDGNAATRYSAVTRDERGDYWGIDRFTRSYGRIDMHTHALENARFLNTILPAAIRVGDELLGVDRITRQIVRVDPTTGVFEPLSETFGCCGSFGIADLGGTIYVTYRQVGIPVIASFDRATGTFGAPVTLTGVTNLHIEEMRAFDGVLYASTNIGQLMTIEPITGTVTALPVFPGRAHAMEVFD